MLFFRPRKRFLAWLNPDLPQNRSRFPVSKIHSICSFGGLQAHFKKTSFYFCFLLFVGCHSGCAQPDEGSAEPPIEMPTPPLAMPESSPQNQEQATLGAGCFWCIEAVLQRIDGVKAVDSGFMGGQVPNPTYEQVVRKDTGHAEVVQVTFDPGQLPYAALLEVFWALHDPTTVNRQGADVGPQYRSVIFYHSEAQRETAEASKARFNQEVFGGRIVTVIEPAETFYKADISHQDYYDLNPQAGYCRVVIAPKLKKLGLPVAPVSAGD
jgi:peptide-methionine (S)-S-oxide reductase